MSDLQTQIQEKVKRIKPKRRSNDWRWLFDADVLARAEQLVQEKRITDLDQTNYSAQGIVHTGSGIANQAYVRITSSPTDAETDWEPATMYCEKHPARISRRRRSYYGFYDEPDRTEVLCVHKAALLLAWEQIRGPWVFTETEEEIRYRVTEELRIEELTRQDQIRKKEEKTTASASDILPPPEEDAIMPFFDLRTAAKRLSTNRYELTRAGELLEVYRQQLDCSGSWYGLSETEIGIKYTRGGEQYLAASVRYWDADCNYGQISSVRHCKLSLTMDKQIRVDCDCGCGRERGRLFAGESTPSTLCAHALALLSVLHDHIMANDPGDATDRTAEQFFEAFGEAAENVGTQTAEEPVEKTKNITLTPRIVMESGTSTLSFKVGYATGRQFILKNIRALLTAWENAEPFTLSKQAAIDFSTATWAEESMPWVTLIQRRVDETDSVNDRLQTGRTWGFYRRPATIRVQNQETLTGSMLDRFYDLAEGKACEYQNKANPGAQALHIGHAPLRISLTSRRIAGSADKFIGVEVSGHMPVLLYGATDLYTIDDRALSRISKDEEAALLPFTRAADENGAIRFRVGKERLAEFYYRVVPALLNNPIVRFEDSCAEEAEPFLPPEGNYTFHLDVEDGMIQCRATASYGEDDPGRPIPAYEADRSGYVDKLQEDRIEKAIRRFFEGFDATRRIFGSVESDERLFKIQTEAVPVLERYGTVMGTDAFRRSTVIKPPAITVGVSIDSGLLELSVLSKGLTPDELLGVLANYREKKKYYRLKSGEFVGLADAEGLKDIDRMMTEMDLSPEEVIKKGVKLPSYRALYLDRLLEQHEALAADRDRTYRALIKNFRTIRDADYDVPAAEAGILRPYQEYGYKWLRTLEAAGFSGILADEMGLGKTLQMITLIQAMKEAGELDAPVLIVCPASLVYNWQEEFTRFAPGLHVAAVAGGLAARKKLLATLTLPEQTTDAEPKKRRGRPRKIKEAPALSARPDVFITSYDLCRKDLEAYRSVTLSLAVLDEAQYIKNQKAGLTKAVKALGARRRFALTGTPIENRLAELWSIFDFLMPGFLYRYDEFAARIENPVTKNQDEAMTKKLRAMVGPFVLRRLKTDVLKDLPPKLEEVRYARFEEEQRKIYDGQVVRMKEMILNGGGSGEDRIRIFAELMRIRQICCDPSLLFEDYAGGSAKREACIELIKTAMEAGHRMLVFSQFTSMLSLLEEDLRREGIGFFTLTGQTPKEKRIRLVHDFNNGDTPVFLISLKAGGTGLNLTGADVVIHYDPWWNVAAQDQATDRAHRIGQQNTVTVYRLIAKGSIEEKILNLQEVKKDLADAVLSGESSSIYTLTDEELLGLLDN